MDYGEILRLLAIRPRVFISYHHERDQWAYDGLSSLLHDTYELVTDRSLDSEIDSADPEYIMRRIREDFITGTSCTIVLCGPESASRKFIDWEIKATLDKEHGLLGIDLPSSLFTPPGPRPWRLHDNLASGYAVTSDWTSVNARPSDVRALIAVASSRSKWLINNSRAMMTRNG